MLLRLLHYFTNDERRLAQGTRDRTNELGRLLAQTDDRRIVVFKNTMISYMFRKRFLNLVRAITALQRRARLRRFRRGARQRYRTRRANDPDQLLRATLKYRAELLVELARLDAIVKAGE